MEPNIRSQGYFETDSCDLEELKMIVGKQQEYATVPHAKEVPKGVPVYDTPALAAHFTVPSKRRCLMVEWASVLENGAGVFVLRQAQPDHEAIDVATAVYQHLIAEEKSAGGQGADHFAAAGNNDRLWNSLQKLCLASPDTFIRYFACPAMDTAAEAWLGPNYQMTAQVNLVRPGGKAQSVHRDYHLGFQSEEECARYPAHVHGLSPYLTLQGGLAHGEVPLESGPTQFLPGSQRYRPGYAAWRREDFRAFFDTHAVQLPLKKGDALFFNPALFHAAGENRSADIHRLVNLFQVSSAFGRAMESVDRVAMCKTLVAPLSKHWREGTLSDEGLQAVIAASAEGYPFPTNLDRDPPGDGLAPISQAELFKRAVLSNESATEFSAKLDERQQRTLAH